MMKDKWRSELSAPFRRPSRVTEGRVKDAWEEQYLCQRVDEDVVDALLFHDHCAYTLTFPTTVKMMDAATNTSEICFRSCARVEFQLEFVLCSHR